jgi:hypothetical protein
MENDDRRKNFCILSDSLQNMKCKFASTVKHEHTLSMCVCCNITADESVISVNFEANLLKNKKTLSYQIRYFNIFVDIGNRK